MCTEHKMRFSFNTFFSKWEKIHDCLQIVYIFAKKTFEISDNSNYPRNVNILLKISDQKIS